MANEHDDDDSVSDTGPMSVAAEYAAGSSMHGIGHVVGGNPRQKLFWSVLVIFGLSMAIYHLRYHLQNYIDTPMATEIQHEAADFSFPDVTFCSLTPTTARMYTRMDVPNRFGLTREDFLVLGSFYSYPELKKWQTNYTVDTEIHRNVIYRQRATYSSHKRSFFPSNEMIFSCEFQGKDCREDFHLVNDPNFWNCYTFVPKERTMPSTSPEDGLSVNIYTATQDIEEFKDKLQLYDVEKTFFNYENVTGFLSEHNTGGSFYARILQNKFEPAGVKIVIHKENTYPYAKENGFVLANGMYAKIGLDMYKENRLNRKEQECTEEDPTSIIRQTVDTNGAESTSTHILTEEDCELYRRQQYVIDTCGCRSHEFPYQADIDGPQLCYNYTNYLAELQAATGATFTNWADHTNQNDASQAFVAKGNELANQNPEGMKVFKKYKDQIDCHDNVIKKNEYPDGEADCIFGCSETIYKYQGSSVRWPRDYDVFRLMDKVILPAIKLSNGSFKDIAKDLLTIDKSHENMWTTSTKIVESNFAHILIYPKNLKGSIHQENYSYSIFELLSEIGGIMGLYLGCSVLTFFEALDLLMECCASSKKEEKRNRRSPAPVPLRDTNPSGRHKPSALPSGKSTNPDYRNISKV